MKMYYEHNIGPNRTKVEAISGEKRNNYLQNGDKKSLNSLMSFTVYFT